VIADNDLSGSGRVVRPGFDRLVELIDGHHVDLVLAVDLNRLSRGFELYIQVLSGLREGPDKGGLKAWAARVVSSSPAAASRTE